MNKNVMYQISYGLYVLTVRLGEKDNGCIINTAGQVTTAPNRITLAVNKQNLTHDMLMHTKEFNISILSEKAEFSLFQRFGFQSGREADKFAGFPVKRSENGIVYVNTGACAFLSGKVADTMDLGTHTLFLADVTDGEMLSSDAPATYGFYHKNIKPAPDKTEKKSGWRCKICGYIYEGEELPADFVCPVCKHGAIDFEKIS